MRGFSSWIRSHEKPMRSMAPGAKFSTSTSQCRISFSKISLPESSLVFSVMPRLLWFSMVKYRLSTLGMSCSCPRVASPTPGRSTLMTSAPNQARSWVQVGPDCTWVMSRILTPSRALLIASFLFLRVEIKTCGYLRATTRCGLRFPIRPLSVPAEGSMTAFTRVGLPESMAAFTAWLSSSGEVAVTPTPPKPAIIMS